MEVNEEFGSAPGEKELGGPNRIHFSFVLCVHSFSFVRRFWGGGDQGSLLGSIRPIWDRI